MSESKLISVTINNQIDAEIRLGNHLAYFIDNNAPDLSVSKIKSECLFSYQTAVNVYLNSTRFKKSKETK